VTYCPRTGKASYDNKSQASTARRKIDERLSRSHSRRRRFEQTVYRCKFCLKWHLASA
jgi:hypothetical protein